MCLILKNKEIILEQLAKIIIKNSIQLNMNFLDKILIYYESYLILTFNKEKKRQEINLKNKYKM